MNPSTPKRNRVAPTGDIIAVEMRGAWLGNRGVLHRAAPGDPPDVVRFHASKLWIICALEYRGRWMRQWRAGHYTALFFHDEAVAFAAGHRPCAQCRRGPYQDYRRAWSAGAGGPLRTAAKIDRQLHGERIVRGTHRRRFHPAGWSDLPAGTFVSLDARPALVLDTAVVPWTTVGYADPLPRPAAGTVEVITPPSTVAAFAAGYRPQIDPSAMAAVAGGR